jgi:hypothetical protein
LRQVLLLVTSMGRCQPVNGRLMRIYSIAIVI